MRAGIVSETAGWLNCSCETATRDVDRVPEREAVCQEISCGRWKAFHSNGFGKSVDAVVSSRTHLGYDRTGPRGRDVRRLLGHPGKLSFP